MGDVSELREFLIESCAPPQLVSSEAVVSDRPCRRVWTFELDVMLLCAKCPGTAAVLYSSPFSRLLQIVKQEVLETMGPHTKLMEHELCIRPVHVPPLLCATAPSHTKGTEGTLVQLSGTIIRLCAKRVVAFERQLRCPLCRKEVRLPTDPADRPQQQRPRCDGKSCKGAFLAEVGNVWMDYSECRLQQLGRSGGGNLPRSVLVTLDDELASKFTAGQAVKVVGMARSRWKQTTARAIPRVELVVWALNVTALEHGGDDELEGGATFSPEGFASSISNFHVLRTRLIQSTCPQLSGLIGPRLGLLLATLGGAEAKDARSGHRVRGTVHCLFVGDPSTGKSELLRSAVALAPRSVMTTGFTSTSAGLTAAATKEFGEWALEPGALVLSDGGSCVIDELRTVSAADRTALHEAMEQQTISVAKAGLVAKLRTESSVIAACNPPMKRGSTASGAEVGELGVGGPLLSRFDLIFILWDTATMDHDSTIAAHILSCSAPTCQPVPLNTEDLRTFLCHSRGKYLKEGGPLLSPEAAQLIAAYYESQRARGASPALSDAIPVTVRLLESLVRLSQAHAKLVFKPLCDIWDAALAVFLMERTGHALKARVAGMSTADGQQLYTSSKELEECFIDDSPHGVQCQQEVLEIMVSTFSAYAPTSGPVLDLMSQCTDVHAAAISPAGPRSQPSPVSLSPPTTEYDDRVSLNGRAVAVYPASFQPSQVGGRSTTSVAAYFPGELAADDPCRPIELASSPHHQSHSASVPPVAEGPDQSLLSQLRSLQRNREPVAVPPRVHQSQTTSAVSDPFGHDFDSGGDDQSVPPEVIPPAQPPVVATTSRLGMGALRGGGFKPPRAKDDAQPATSAEDVMRSLRFSFRK